MADAELILEDEAKSEGWIFILLSHPEKVPMKLLKQPVPKPFVHIAVEGGKKAIVFTMIGKDDKGKVAFYVYGSWNFGDPETFFKRDK